MLKVGLTGGIGSGKSIVASIFKKLGVPVYTSDLRAKKLMNSNAELIQKLTSEFGSDIYENQKLNRKKLSALIYNDDQKLANSNAIVHPYVRTDFTDWCNEHSSHPYIINESALVFSSGLINELDKVVSVVAPLKLRVSRVIIRDKTTKENIEQIAAKQTTDNEFKAKSDYIITNDDTQLILPQILAIHKSLLNVN